MPAWHAWCSPAGQEDLYDETFFDALGERGGFRVSIAAGGGASGFTNQAMRDTTIDMPIQPFLFAGAAWRRYDLTNTSTNTSDVKSEDDVVEFPMGVGLAAHLSGAILDIRGEFRASTMEDLMPDPTSSNSTAELHRWGAKATIGYEF